MRDEIVVGERGGRRLTYVADDPVRPHIRTVVGPGSRTVTRDLTDGVPADSDDHVHHKGIWWGHRDVGGADVWTEFDGHGRIGGIAAPEVSADGDVTQLLHRTTWYRADSSAILDDTRTIRIHPVQADESQAIDVESVIVASDGSVLFSDTKEAGLVAVRVNPQLEERRGGRIELASGVVGESDAWGRPAAWCDYSGVVDGVSLGVTIFDHPANPVAARWHVRDYGLMAVNPFGLRDFTGDPSVDGSLTIELGESIRFRYRVLVHAGDATSGDVHGHFSRYLECTEVRAR